MKVVERKSGKVYSAYPQAVDLNYDGRYFLRWIIGIDNYQGFHFIRACYDNNEFNEDYEVVDCMAGFDAGYLAK